MSNAKHTNRLFHESSPYLLQHAHNPVEWYPWGPEAFEKAKRENKPIFLSVGYSTCYWCHVMERESFENEAVAGEMNRLFINIKVDREERPDVDQLYMSAVQVLSGQGGWPMSVFLTPDLKPFYGGTYFPPTDMHGRPGFVTLLRAIADAYKNRRNEIDKAAEQLQQILQQMAEPAAASESIHVDGKFIDAMIDRSVSDYDSVHGGFGHAPKFPRQTLLELLLKSAVQNPQSQMVYHTLDAMADGGIHDHLGGGFHRYSTDAQWLVPHFEIMLYDNAMLGWCYTEAYRQTGKSCYAKVARGIFDFVLREKTSPEGAFFTAFDAEVDGREGESCLWTKDEIVSILGVEDAKYFNRVYGVEDGPNFADPHHGSGQPEKNILFLPQPIDDQADLRLAPLRQKLYQARLKRKQPLLDTKILTSWNALMIRALAHGGKVLEENKYIQAAARAAEYLWAHHRMSDGGLYHTSRDGKARLDGNLDDYAFFIQALLELNKTVGQWLDRSKELANLLLEKFGGGNAGLYFTDKSARDLIVRQKVASDSPLPSGNAVAAMVLLQLGKADAAKKIIAAFAPALQSMGEGMSSMVQAALDYVQTAGAFTVERGLAGNVADRPLTPQQIAAGVVSLRAQWADERRLDVYLNILKGFHINANKVGKGLAGTNLVVEKTEVEGIDYPHGEELRTAFSSDPIDVYSGEVFISIRFRRAMTPVDSIEMALNYQACNENACLPVVTRQLSVVGIG